MDGHARLFVIVRLPSRGPDAEGDTLDHVDLAVAPLGIGSSAEHQIIVGIVPSQWLARLEIRWIASKRAKVSAGAALVIPGGTLTLLTNVLRRPWVTVCD